MAPSVPMNLDPMRQNFFEKSHFFDGKQTIFWQTWLWVRKPFFEFFFNMRSEKPYNFPWIVIPNFFLCMIHHPFPCLRVDDFAAKQQLLWNTGIVLMWGVPAGAFFLKKALSRKTSIVLMWGVPAGPQKTTCQLSEVFLVDLLMIFAEKGDTTTTLKLLILSRPRSITPRDEIPREGNPSLGSLGREWS